MSIRGVIRVTLIHGTFARGAEWTCPDSPFCVRLQRAVGANVAIQAFHWSGRNSHRDRLRAAEELKVFLQETGSQETDAQHFLIAHSHGGNVALYASRAATFAGIVCLATPFILCRPRDYSRMSRPLQYGFGVAWLVATVFFLAAHFSSLDFLGLLVGIGSMAVFAGIASLVQAGIDRLTQYANARAEAIGVRAPACPALSIRHPNDEAFSWLRGVMRVSSAFDAPVDRMARGTETVFGIYGILVIALAALGFVCLILSLVGIDAAWIKAVPIGVAFVLFVVLPIYAFTSLIGGAVAKAAWPALSRQHVLGFGWGRFGDGAMLSMSTRVALDGVEDLSRPWTHGFTFGRLRHSAIHDDEEVADIVGKWIVQR